MEASSNMLTSVPSSFLLRGRISDTNDNWLPEARVTLLGIEGSALTDGNGLFSLPIPSLPKPASPEGPVGFLQIEKEGFQTRKIPIQSTDFFHEFAELAIQWLGVSEECLHRSFSLPGEGIMAIGEGISAEDDPATVSRLLRERLESLANLQSRTPAHADFYGWIPPGDEPLRAVFLISLHGMGCVDHPVLRRFAEQHRVALVGVMGLAVQRGMAPSTLLDAPLLELGDKLGHPEIASLPVLLFGHSNGTGHATAYTSFRPERVIGWISYHSGYGWQLLLPGLERAPGLIMHGQLDRWFENGQEAAFQHLRSARNAPVTMMVEGNVGHGPVDLEATWELIVAFCEACLRLRLGREGELRDISPNEGWLGATYDRSVGGQQLLAIAPHQSFPTDPATASWLPDETFASLWQRYGTTDPRHASA